MKTLENSRFTCLIILLLAALLVTACSPAVPSLPAQSETPTEAVPVTGSGPRVIVQDQDFEGNTIVIERVVSPGQGWIAIHIVENGNLGEAIAVAPVQSGDNQNVTVQIDLTKATPIMHAMLHVDEGEVGKYEFPGPDVPVLVDGQMVNPAFHASAATGASGQPPSITIRDQQVIDGKVVIDEIFSDIPGWVDIHLVTADGKRGKDIGFAPIKAGLNQNVIVTVDPNQVAPVLYAVLHADKGEIGIYELPPGPDHNMEVGGKVVEKTFRTDGKASAQVSTAPASPTVKVSPTMVSSPTAGSSPPLSATSTAAPVGQATATPGASAGVPDLGDLLVSVVDQPLKDGQVVVQMVTSRNPGWVVVFTTQPNGQPGEVIGHAAVKAGQSHEVAVPVDPGKAKGRLFAQLHIDLGTIGTFEFPGADTPIMAGTRLIATTFTVTEGSVAAPVSPAQQPSIRVNDQPVQNGTVTVAEVFSIGETWLVIHKQNPDGKVGTMVGFARVKDGLNSNVVVKVNTDLVTPTLFAMLHEDKGTIGELQFPGPDVPVMVNEKMLVPSFAVLAAGANDVVINVTTDPLIGKYLVDGTGKALYMSLEDSVGASNCTGDCLTIWRPLLATGRLVPGADVVRTKLGVIRLPDGTRQVTYSGSPLYTYVEDTNPGEVNGQGLDGLWFLVTP